MASPSQSSATVRFGPFELDLRSGELLRDGRRQRLQGQPAQLLALLVRRAGELLTREELRARLWPQDTFVDFDHGLNNAVNRIREALDDSAASPRYIETIPRRGYRFVAEVRGAARPALTLVETRAPVETAQGERKVAGVRRRLAWIAAGALIAVMAVLVLRGRVSPAPPRIESVAVLPFANLSGDPAQDYFAEGFSEQLTTDLARVPSLRVISRTSTLEYRGARKPLPQIGRELNVDAVIEGSVARSGNRVPRVHHSHRPASVVGGGSSVTSRDQRAC